MVTPCVSPALARALAARLRDATAAGEQLASFAFSEGAPAPGPELIAGEERAVAHDFLLRVLHGVSEPLAWELLAQAVAGAERTGLDALTAAVGLPRLAVTERVNALIQLGLLTRDLEHDAVAVTPAGEAIFELVCELDAEIAGWLEKRRKG
ncbi:hypothetical protein [Conexibacter sp. DBS9H8]|uniref:hypothetical protein n=1 Tax=Conexibacter sp. DBS9H8 TaxID=2937801 RepID=UPI0020103DAF|nr:hypothetical protein [Conexibacter sp. DBS9H8]